MEKLENFRKELQVLLEKYNGSITASCSEDNDYEFTLWVDDKYESEPIFCGWSGLTCYNL